MVHSVQVSIEHDGALVVLLDIATSLSHAQESPAHIRADAPPTAAYPNTEPKGNKLQRARDLLPPEQLVRDSETAGALRSALASLRKHFDAFSLPWCLDRFPRAAVADAGDPGSDSAMNTSAILPPIVLSSGENRFGRIEEVQGTILRNVSALRAEIRIAGPHVYFVPPRANFMWCEVGTSFRILQQAQAMFDLIVLDPPWANRSVRRSRKYSTADQLNNPFVDATKVVSAHLRPTGMVAVWISNAATVRAETLHSMQQMGLVCQAEWIWLKIAVSGEPVLPLDGVWRKPWEKVMIFTRTPRDVQRTIIVAVPDLHSRKPSLKSLLEEYLPPRYEALELFARNLTAGWWSAGNEVLKFQDSREWTS